MTTRKEIIEQFQSDLSKITVANDYKTEVTTIKLGALNQSSFENQMPGIGFWPYSDVVDEDLMGNQPQRRLKFVIYGYLNVDKGIEDATRIMDFVLDVEKFLNSTDNTFNEDIAIEESTFSVSSFIILFDLVYIQTDFI